MTIGRGAPAGQNDSLTHTQFVKNGFGHNGPKDGGSIVPGNRNKLHNEFSGSEATLVGGLSASQHCDLFFQFETGTRVKAFTIFQEILKMMSNGGTVGPRKWSPAAETEVSRTARGK